MANSLKKKLNTCQTEALLLSIIGATRGLFHFNLNKMLGYSDFGLHEGDLITPKGKNPTYDNVYKFSSHPFGDESVVDGKKYDLAYMFVTSI